VAVLHVPFDDDEPIPEEQTERAIRAGGIVARLVKHQSSVLVTCRAGRNRSGLVTGIALIDLGSSAAGAVNRIRSARGEDALSNVYFVRVLSEYAARRR
jgi:protein-tyrosine phosphatase